MSRKNVRRLGTGAIGLGLLMAFPTTALATRGRVKVVNNTIVTDTGSLIRGARVSLDIWDETPTQADVDTMKNSRGLNAFHVYAEYPGSNKAAGYNSAKVDNIVDIADKSDLYVILTIGSGGGNGTFNGSFVTAFWNYYAPRYKDKTHVIYEICNEPQAWSAPYNSNTLAMEKNAFTQIRGLAPDTHIMLMSYSQPINWTQAANECDGLGISWANASVAFHTYGIDGKEASTLTSFFDALKGKGIAYACTEPNLTLKTITTKFFESQGVSETQFINVHDVATNPSAFTSWITSNNICWTPDFGTWPGCPGGGTGGTGGASSVAGAGGGGAGGSLSNNGGAGGVVAMGGSTSSTTGGSTASTSGGSTTTGGAPGAGGGPANQMGGAPAQAGGAASAAGNANLGAGGNPASGGNGAAGTLSLANGADTQNDGGCSCEIGGKSSEKPWSLALLIGLGLIARRRSSRGA